MTSAPRLKFVNPETEAINDGCPGETTETFINGSGVRTGTLRRRSDRHPVPVRVPAPPVHHGLAALRRAGDPQSKPQRQPDHARHRLQRRAAVPRAHVRLPGDVHMHGSPNRRRVREHRHQRRLDPRAAARGRAESADHPDRGLQPLPDGAAPAGRRQIAGSAQRAARERRRERARDELRRLRAGVQLRRARPAGRKRKTSRRSAPSRRMCPGGTFNPASPEADIHPTKLGYLVMAEVVAVDFLTH